MDFDQLYVKMTLVLSVSKLKTWISQDSFDY